MLSIKVSLLSPQSISKKSATLTSEPTLPPVVVWSDVNCICSSVSFLGDSIINSFSDAL